MRTINRGISEGDVEMPQVGFGTISKAASFSLEEGTRGEASATSLSFASIRIRKRSGEKWAKGKVK
jgi:hypothetical protein